MFAEQVGNGAQDGNLDISDLNVKTDADGNLIDDGDGDDGVGLEESADILRQSIEASYAEGVDKGTKPVKKEDKNEQTVEIGEEKFFEGSVEQLEEIVTDPVKFNGLLNNIYRKAVEKGHNMAVESALRSMPDVVKSQVVQQANLNRAVTQFYEENDDLVPYKQTVAAIATRVASENPQLPLAKVFEVTSTLARKKLMLAAKAKGDGGDKGGKPRFPKKPAGNRGGKQEDLSGQAKEIDDMLSAFGQ
jgi:hypothetical protein